MRKQQWLAGVALVSAVGCAVSSVGTSDPKGASPSTPAPGTAAAPPSQSSSGDITLAQINSALDVGHAIDKTTFRVAGDPDVADFRIQTRIRLAEARAKQPYGAPKNFPWTVTTNAPIRTTPAAFGATFETPSNSDLVAFAADTNQSGSAGGIKAGTANTCPSGTCSAASQFFLGSLYNSQPVIAGWGGTTANKFELGAQMFSFNPAAVEVFSLAFGVGNVFCFKISSGWSTTGTATNSAGACTGWSNTNPISVGGNAITWSEPFPAYDSLGNITNFYYGDNAGKLQCVTDYVAGSPPTFTTPKPCANYGTSGSAGQTPTGGPGTAFGPPIVYRLNATTNYIYVGDASGNFYQIEDVSGTLTSYKYNLGATAAFAIHGGPAAYYASTVAASQIYVAAGGNLYVFPFEAASQALWKPTYTLALSGAGTSPIDGEIILDSTASGGQNMLYLATNNTLYKAGPYPLTGSSPVYATALYNTTAAGHTVDAQTIAAASEPLGYPLPWAGSVFVATGTGSASPASGALEEYNGCHSSGSASAPYLIGKSNASTYGDLVETGIIIDNGAESLLFGYDSGSTSGGLVSYPLPSYSSSSWACPATTTLTANKACGGTSPGCVPNAACTSNANCFPAVPSTPVCNTSSGKCVECNTSADCYSTACLAAGNCGGSASAPVCNPATATVGTPNTCVACLANTDCYDTGGAGCSASPAHCTGSSALSACQNTNTDNALFTCVACTASDNTCTGTVCETRSATPSEVINEYTCVQCVGPNWTGDGTGSACGNNELCNQDEGEFFDTCIDTTPIPGAVHGNQLLFSVGEEGTRHRYAAARLRRGDVEPDVWFLRSVRHGDHDLQHGNLRSHAQRYHVQFVRFLHSDERHPELGVHDCRLEQANLRCRRRQVRTVPDGRWKRDPGRG